MEWSHSEAVHVQSIRFWGAGYHIGGCPASLGSRLPSRLRPIRSGILLSLAERFGLPLVNSLCVVGSRTSPVTQVVPAVQGAREIRVVAVIQIAAAIPTVVVMLKTVANICFLGRTSTWLEKEFVVRF